MNGLVKVSKLVNIVLWASLIGAGPSSLYSSGNNKKSESLDISEEVKFQKTPRLIKRKIWYKIGDMLPDTEDKNGEAMAVKNFTVELPYIDTKQFKVTAKSETGKVLILADVTDEPKQGKNDGSDKYIWKADCRSYDPNVSHPKDTCHVGRWTKDQDDDPNRTDAVAYGSWFIKLISYGEARGVELHVDYEERFDDVDINFTLNGKPHDPDKFQAEAGKKTDLKFSYNDPNGKLLDFSMYHGKMMHIVVFKPDLSHIAHIHPDYNMMKKEFSLALNTTRKGDMDNKDLPNALPDGGTYYLLTEVQPTMYKNQTQAWFSRFKVNVTGTPKESVPLEIEFHDDMEYFDKYFTEDGKEGEEGDYLKVRMTKTYHDNCFKWGLQFTFYASFWDGEKYVPVSSEHFGRWLMMPGHAIYIKEEIGKTNDLNDRYFSHAHAPNVAETDGTGKLDYPIHVHGISIPEGTFKIWAQTRFKGKIYTFPYVFDVKIPVLGLDTDPYGSGIKKTACSASL